MSAFDHLPLIDPTEYFNSPAVPDGEGVGYVGADGIVYDRHKQPIGRDKSNPRFHLDHLRRVIEGLDRGTVAQTAPSTKLRDLAAPFNVGAVAQPDLPPPIRDYETERNRPGATFQMHPKREIVSLFECSYGMVAQDNAGGMWMLSSDKSHWTRMRLANLPPLPQE